MGIQIINGGFMTTVQDLGRYGYQETGMAVSGAMDTRSATLANLLVGNDENEGVLEVTIMGPTITFTEANVFAITGGDLGAKLDEVPVPRYEAVVAREGQTLTFSGVVGGARAYIAFAGGLDIPKVMGSVSTNLKAEIGGLNGKKLAAGDEIGFVSPDDWIPHLKDRKVPVQNFGGKPITVRVTLGPQKDHFKQSGIDTFLNREYTVTNECDRMGIRMEGPVIAHKEGGDIITDGISFGAVQVPSHGNPIVMMADHQTTGGYTKIANVISVDLPLLAQAMPGDKVCFRWMTVGEAQMLYRAEKQQFEALKEKWSGPDERPVEPEIVEEPEEIIEEELYEDGENSPAICNAKVAALGGAIPAVPGTNGLMGVAEGPAMAATVEVLSGVKCDETRAIALAAAAEAHADYWNNEGTYKVTINKDSYRIHLEK